jgi:hypothetical protein
MRRIIFYSWQSDLPNATNRGLIQKALENVAAAIAADGTVAVEPVIDRDTQGVAGAPDIASTIFAKITTADLVVADISITSRAEAGRPTPNPNVLIELGYALKALGHERVILVMNRAFGKIEELPFDLRARRVAVYDMPEVVRDRAPVRLDLERTLDAAIRAALDKVPTELITEAPIPAVAALEADQANRILILRRNLVELLKKLDALQPTRVSEGGTVENLLAAIDQTQEIVGEFSKIAETIAGLNALDAALEAYRWFGGVFERYDLPEGHNGRVSNADCDYFKFLGHELFVSLIAFLLREQRWDTIQRLLQEPIPMHYKRQEHGPGTALWDDASEHLALLLDESRRRNRVSLHADILKSRHSTGGLGTLLPFDDFLAADFLLFLRGELAAEQPGSFITWRPWSALYLNRAPLFMRLAENQKTALQVAKVAGVPNIAEFKSRFRQRAPKLRELFRSFWDWPIDDADIDRIGMQQPDG